MKAPRREFLAGTAAVLVSGGLVERAGAAAPYSLSSRNPLATQDQRDLDAFALRLWARPDIQAAKQRTAGAFEIVTSHTVSEERKGLFRQYLDSFCFRSIQMAVNSDAEYPKIMRVYTPAARWLGNDLPESRWGQENPDNAYRIIPVGYGGRYVIEGRRGANPPSHVSYTLVADTNTSVTLALLEQHDLEVKPDGTFVLTLDETPANGRKNHLQLTPEALYLFIRDTMGDWRQAPNALQVRRIGQPSRAPLSEDELAARAARVMQLGVAPAYYWMRLIDNIALQTMERPQLTGASGGLLTQMSTAGRFELPDDRMAVIIVDPVEADYRSAVLYDMWGRSLEYAAHQTSLNNATMAADRDGRYTIVIAKNDPGVQNWLDTTGLHEVSVGFRWQGLTLPSKRTPTVTAKVMAAADAAALVESRAKPVSAAERAEQILRRQRLHAARFEV